MITPKKVEEKFKKVEDLVWYCLKNFPETRDNDRTLMLKVWDIQGFRIPQKLIALFYRVASAETIRRQRQMIQQKGFYRPDPQKVAERSLYSMAHRQFQRERKTI